jgi:hypothetical protein
MKGQAEAGQARREHRPEPARDLFPLAAEDNVVGQAEQPGSAVHPGSDVALVPGLQDLMPEEIGHQ